MDAITTKFKFSSAYHIDTRKKKRFSKKAKKLSNY